MHQLCRRADGGAALLRWLSNRTGCWVGLLDRAGAVLAGKGPVLEPAAVSQVSAGVAEMLDRGLAAFAIDEGAVLLAVDVPAGVSGPVLAFVGSETVPRSLAGDAAMLLGTCWWAGEIRRVRDEVDAAEARCREAVLHLLMSQHVATARQVASALLPSLPDPVRVHVIETGAGERGEVVRRCAELTGGSAWIVRCPVYLRHIIVVAAEPADGPLEAAIASEIGGCVVGAGDVVALRDTAAGYEQAFHALAVARGRAQRFARFDRQTDLATIVGPQGLAWADALVKPLLTHVPARTTDPDAQELTATARSWLSFSMAATRHLKIHRNTLSARLRRIEELLGLDLARVQHQAELDLALRVRAVPRPPDPVDADGVVALDELIRLPAVQHWAQVMLRPVREAAHASRLESTLRAWLDSNARLSATAATLGISVAGTRKRVDRLEQILQRSLLQAPDARHDLWLALHASDLGNADG